MDPLESEDSASFADAWEDLKIFALCVAAAVSWTYVLVPLFNPSWIVL